MPMIFSHKAALSPVDALCAAVDKERDRRLALDFSWDFGSIPAFDDDRSNNGPGHGEEIPAGVRLLQMKPKDQALWQALQVAALTAMVSGAASLSMPMRAEDNWNIQTTAGEVLVVLSAMIAHGSSLVFYGGALKSAIRAASHPASIDITAGWPERP